MEARNDSKTPSWRLTIPFFAALSVLSVISFILPLRPEKSQLEKRYLSTFPEFSLEALTSGEYFDAINLWFSDTFPGRESWLTVATTMQSLYGWSDVAVSGDRLTTGDNPTVPVFNPEDLFEDSEPTEETRSTEAALAETSAASQPEETAQTEATEETWGGVNAADDTEVVWSQTVIQIGDAAFSALGFSQTASNKYIKALNRFAEVAQEYGATIISAPAPTAVGVLVEEEYQYKLRSSSQEDTLNYLHDGMDERIIKVDTVNALLAHNSEYIYFRTDHHWTALGAYYSYCALCEALDMEPVDIDTLEMLDMGEFVGSLFGSAAYPWKLRKDTVYAWVPAGDVVNTVYESMTSHMEYPVIADTSERDSDSKYLCFGTDWPMNHLENFSLDEDAPNCIVVKDSFGNCFCPWLTQNFRNVYAVDYRKFNETTLSWLMSEYDIDYVIFMPYLTATQSEEGVKLLDNIAR